MSWHPDTPYHYRNQILIGDSRVLWAALPPESVDLILVDPVYQDTAFYGALAAMAIRTLRPHGCVLAFTSNPNLCNVRMAMEAAGMEYVWHLTYTVVAKAYPMRFYGIFCWSTPCVWMQRPGSPSKTQRFIPDTFLDYSGQPSSDHEWNKSEPVILEWLDAFCPPDGVVLDTNVGSGPVPVAAKMLDRRFIGFEINPRTAWDARVRLNQTRRITHRQERMELPGADRSGLLMAQASMETIAPALGGPAVRRPKRAK